MRLSLFVLMIFLSFLANGQGKINLMNGKIIEFDSIGKAGNNKFFYISHYDKEIASIRSKRIFSIVYPDGKEEIIFTPDSTISDLNVPQMKDYVKGEQDCRQFYKPKLATIGGLIIGGGAGFFGFFYGPLLPAIYATYVTASNPPDVTKKPYCDKNYINNDYYAYGFETQGRKKKLSNALCGGGIGLAASLIAYVIIEKRH
jgi:hypothetical protein